MEQLLATKLFIPSIRPELVSRPRLIDQLNDGLHRKLTIISAPAGFGKTTLVSEWVDELRGNVKNGNRVAWLSLDDSENNPSRFLTYFIAALNRANEDESTLGESTLNMLQSPQLPPPETVLTPLINEITSIPDRIILVLDDYHLIDAQPVHDFLSFLLENIPPQLHLVIATREDPHLPLARLRARSQLTELRAADLRFTLDEASAFLNRMTGLDLSMDDVSALETRTEGWIAGLQMAALSMQGRADTLSFIKAFTGSHRYVLDYLIEEVLQRQPDHVGNFLLQTAILDRLSGPLCDAVTGHEDGREMLETLERGNLFVVPLDDQRQWYRYHHLFADVLQARSMDEQPGQVFDLHRRASEWYEQNDMPSDAIRHALAGKDFERAAGLIELAWSAMDISFQSAIWLGWVKELPEELVRARPVLSAGCAWAFLDGGEMEAAEAQLQAAERWLDSTGRLKDHIEDSSTKMVVVDEELFRSLPAIIATARAYHAQALGDLPGTVKYARRALELTPEDDQLRRSQTTALLGLTQYASGDLEAADRSLTDFRANMLKANNLSAAISTTYVLADIRVALGRLHAALNFYEQSIQIALKQGEPIPLGTADLYRGISELYLERGDLEAATQHLLTGKKLGEQTAITDWQHRLCVTESRIRAAQGDLTGSLDLLDKAEQLYVRNPLPDVRPIAALRARVWIKQGRLTDALEWARERGLSVDDELGYLSEFEHITLARVLIAQYTSDRVDASIHKAMGLLEHILKAAEAGGRVGSVIEILVLQTLAHQAQNNIHLALVSLERALTLAEPEDYFHVFADEGQPMGALLRETAKQGVASNYVRQLLDGFTKTESRTLVKQSLVEPLSERELEVLKLLRSELNGPEIARELMVSLNTMRTHTKNIYNKLGVNNRRAAIRRAEELSLL